MLDKLFEGRWFERILRLHLGERMDLQAPTAKQALVRYYVALSEGELIEACESRTHAMPNAHAVYRRLRRPGDEVRLSQSNKDYLGSLSVIAESKAELTQALATVEPQLHWRISPSGGHAAELRA
jgi:hypothetical protein